MAREWVADPSIAWRILLTARLTGPPDTASLGSAFDVLRRRQGWSAGQPLLVDDDTAALQRRLTARQPDPVVLGLADRDLVVSAHHSAVDGLGLLAVLGAVLDQPVGSDARGVADRPAEGSLARAAARRLREAAVAPPARVATSGATSRSRTIDDVLVDLTLPGHRGASALVHAATRAVVAHNRAAGAATRHVAVAIGAARPGAGTDIADRSALIRLRDVECLAEDEVAAAVRTAPLQAPVAAGGRARARLMGTVLRLLAPRLGSTLLVSYLGRVSAPGVERLAFYPVTAGAGGISLGAVGLDGDTVLSLRARAADWDREGLQRLLRAVASELG